MTLMVTVLPVQLWIRTRLECFCHSDVTVLVSGAKSPKKHLRYCFICIFISCFHSCYISISTLLRASGTRTISPRDYKVFWFWLLISRRHIRQHVFLLWSMFEILGPFCFLLSDQQDKKKKKKPTYTWGVYFSSNYYYFGFTHLNI